MSIILERSASESLSNSDSPVSTKSKLGFKGRCGLSKRTRYYYQTFDSSSKDLENYSYSFKR